jgi:hypothetical protein
MVSTELIKYYESLIDKQRPLPQEENQYLTAYLSEIRDLWEKRVILRELRYRSGMSVCSGEVDCLESPTSSCMRGEHPTCPGHTDSCFLCDPTVVLRPVNAN